MKRGRPRTLVRVSTGTAIFGVDGCGIASKGLHWITRVRRCLADIKPHEAQGLAGSAVAITGFDRRWVLSKLK